MADSGVPPDIIDRGVNLTQRRLRGWPGWAQHAYALVVTAGWLFTMTAVGFMIVALARGDVSSTVTRVLLVWVAIFAVVTMSWLLWHMAVPLYANLASQGRFGAWRRERLALFDTWFNRVALVVLLSIVLAPILQVFE